jgi:DNA-binding LacI/PurR family transcriptional regulator
MAKVTIRDIAKRAQVGVGTVSRVLNNSSSVSEETRHKVLSVIKELDYSPSLLARRLSLGRTQTVGVVLPFLTLPSFVERLRGVQHALGGSEYDLVLFSVDSPERRDQYFHELTRGSRADGLLIISLAPDDVQAERFLANGIATVLIDALHPSLHRVVVDDVKGGYLAAQHLIDLGHRRIAFLSDHLESPYRFVSMRQRYRGYQQALEEAHLPASRKYLRQGPHGREEAQRMAAALLRLPEPPSAIFAASDTQAIGVLDAARDHGLKVPDQLSVIGYDGIRDAEYLDLTTIEQPLFNSGVVGVETLLQVLESDASPAEANCLPIELIVRGTTAPPSST